ncbi:MAG: GNAT family N-acetyltransferase [Kofleriaceae bacterium]|nr:GNAT family N-acetyltransferase [Kofleriaceae bacterium]
MERISLSEFENASKHFDESVESMSGVDHFCSASDWILPATESLMPPRKSWVFREGLSYWAFMRGQHPEGFYYIEALEAMWALACPVVGLDDKRLVAGVEELCSQPTEDWKIMVISGLPSEHPVFTGIVQKLASTLRLGLGQSTVRLIVDLSGGFDAFLSRRSRQFRRSLARAQRKASAAEITIVDASTEVADKLYQRIVAVEKRGWKGLEAVGIDDGPMHEFYKKMLPRLSARGAERVLFARHEGRYIGYILGGIRKNSYRGLQFSFDADYKQYGLGNLLQAEQIARLCDEGVASYDLGTHMDYKTRWADHENETLTLLLMRD